MYSVEAYGRMLADEIRTRAYVRALEQAIQPESVVVDLGSGPGFFALLSAKLGCRHVYAIEPDNVIQIGIDSARVNGVADRITFIQDFSTNVSLPEPANIIVADLRGVLPFFTQNLPSIQDARKRLLAPDGVLIPRRDRLWAALVSNPVRHQKLTTPWTQVHGISLPSAQQIVLNMWSKFHPETNDLLSAPVKWHTIDYYTDLDIDVRADITFEASQSGIAHGVAVWFDSELTEEIVLSNAPGAGELIYGKGFFPFLKPVELTTGDLVNLRIRADLIKDDYVWTWETRIEDRVHFKQSSLFGSPLSPTQLKKRASSYVPIPNHDALVEAYVVSQMDGASTLEDIAARVLERFPGKLSKSDALDLVADLSVKFS